MEFLTTGTDITASTDAVPGADGREEGETEVLDDPPSQIWQTAILSGAARLLRILGLIFRERNYWLFRMRTPEPFGDAERRIAYLPRKRGLTCMPKAAL